LKFKGSIEAILYAKTTGLIYQMDDDSEEEDSELDEGEESDSGEEDDGEEEGEIELDEDGNPIRKKKRNNKNDPFDGMTKQERQKLVKEQNRDRRANKKMDKYTKKKLVAKTSRRGKK